MGLVGVMLVPPRHAVAAAGRYIVGLRLAVREGTEVSTISRRTFFQGAALAASATRVIGANDTINVGIVGLGARGV